jgi:hypothetical protein
MPLIAAVAAVFLVAGVGLVGFFVTRPAPEPQGYILVDLPSSVRGPMRVNINGKDVDPRELPKSGPLVQSTKAGSTLVMVSAEGYKTFTQTVVVAEGATPRPVPVKLEREVQVAQVVVVTQPPDAELKVGDKVVREKGNGSPFIGEVPAGEKVVVSASAPGFKPAQKALELAAGDKPASVQLTLERSEPEGFEVQVLSTPSGATILAGGQELGVTPKLVRLPMSVKQVSLKLRCHEDVDVDVAPGDGAPSAVRQRLKKQRGCK